MKALMLTSYGTNIRKNVQIMDIEKPVPDDGDLLIKIKAASINPVDYKMVYGNVKLVWNPQRPFPLGFDCAGIVESTGRNTRQFKVGDEVYVRVPLNRVGTLAEYICTPENVVALKPKNLSFAEAASIPLIACTVLQSFKHHPIKSGENVLIHAGSGGVGSFAVQYAKSLGAEVYSTTSTRNVQWVKDLGAKRVIDYRSEDYKEIVPKLDLVFDTLGADYVNEAVSLIRDGGSIISIAGQKDNSTLKELKVPGIIRFFITLPARRLKAKLRKKNAKYKYVLMTPNQDDLNQVSEMLESGQIKPIVDREFSLNDAVEALLYLETGRAQGKVIVVP